MIWLIILSASCCTITEKSTNMKIPRNETIDLTKTTAVFLQTKSQWIFLYILWYQASFKKAFPWFFNVQFLKKRFVLKYIRNFTIKSSSIMSHFWKDYTFSYLPDVDCMYKCTSVSTFNIYNLKTANYITGFCGTTALKRF